MKIANSHVKSRDFTWTNWDNSYNFKSYSFLSQWDIGKFSPQWDLNFSSYEISTWVMFFLFLNNKNMNKLKKNLCFNYFWLFFWRLLVTGLGVAAYGAVLIVCHIRIRIQLFNRKVFFEIIAWFQVKFYLGTLTSLFLIRVRG